MNTNENTADLAFWKDNHRILTRPVADRGAHKLLPEFGQLRPGQTVEVNGLPKYGWGPDNGEYTVVEIWQCRDMINSARALLQAGAKTIELSVNVRGMLNDAFASIRVTRDARQLTLRGVA